MSELTRGRHRLLFLKKANRRTEEENKHIDQVVKVNDKFLKLELIKERMITFFDQPDVLQARYAFHDVGKWIIEENFTPLKKWWFNLNSSGISSPTPSSTGAPRAFQKVSITS